MNAQPSSKASIFIVEDAELVSYHLKISLENLGYNVIGTAPSGEKALKLIGETYPDLILMDIMLEDELDGIETAEIIKQKYDIPVIYLTALNDSKTIERAKVTEPYAYIIKPFEERELSSNIEMALYKFYIDKKLKESEEKFYTTVRSIGEAIVIVNKHFQITYLNPIAEEYSGIVYKENTTTNFLELIETTKRLILEKVLTQCLMTVTPQPIPFELKFVHAPDQGRNIGDGMISPIQGRNQEVSGFVITFRDISARIANEKIKERLQKQRLSDIIEGQEQERLRVAKEVHDSLGQMLNALKFNIDDLFISVDANNNKTANIKSLINEIIDEAGRISDNLAPPLLNDFDLKTCLNSLCNKKYESAGKSIQFSAYDVPEIEDQKIKINLYRIAQEAINNALKHSEANNIDVQLFGMDTNLRMMIEDNGSGFDIDKALDKKRFGLQNMKERTQIMNGQFDIDSNKEMGTVITVDVPIKEKAIKQ